MKGQQRKSGRRPARQPSGARVLASSRGSRRLTGKQRLLIKGLQEGKSVLQAALAAGYAPSTAKSHVYQSPAVRSAVAELMDRQGLGDETLLAKLKEKLEATERRNYGKSWVKLPVHHVQLQALDMALKLKGLYPAAKVEVTKRDFGAFSDEELDAAIRAGELGEGGQGGAG